ncbi:hypothetical protein DBZ36_08365 [Alginatibacterium sediminis]|uniref:Uncharacterized protein n=1 Tax=Alginatibacterium sediminis TaxID=2164068 RepID=A0A420EI93_9ALTE|nr:hypothetical protein [Alginatibacterium sediminis]RKF20441.1 hypothetical protein DBZ36_08365 [Alginatibacterium sediminis]
MKLLYVGDESIFLAINRFLQEKDIVSEKLDNCLDLERYVTLNYDIVVLHCRFYRQFIENGYSSIVNKVIVIGPYTDSYAKQRFSCGEKYNYISFSDLESQFIESITPHEFKTVA